MNFIDLIANNHITLIVFYCLKNASFAIKYLFLDGFKLETD